MAEIILTDTHIDENNIEVNKSVFRQTCEYCVERGVKRIIHTGDFFRSRKSQTLENLKDGFMEILDLVGSYGLTLLAIPGNHDKVDYKSADSYLDIFQHHPNFVLFREHYQFEHNNFSFHFLPFFDNDEYLPRLRAIEVVESKKNILFTHIGIYGAVMNNGMVVEGIPVAEFAKFDKVMVGHYHDEQYFGSNICYFGASIQHNYGEKPSKGLTVLEDLKLQTIPLCLTSEST
jgi:DNA repair exonuclease SbcCD nuclease subunit